MGNDELIVLAVVLSRLVVPLFIFRFPLPAILLALVIDAADQTIFQNSTDLELTGYQGYDKALDVYYLAIAYLSTFRNWTDPFAARAAQLLWYYRLCGVVAFELTQVRALLIVFPNTFEYFFIAYEVVRVAWNPARLGARRVVLMVVAIWLFVKLPQEYWIHIAQLDFTDVMKRDVFGVEVTSSWSDAIGENLWFVAVLAVLVAVVVVVARRAVGAAPPPDWRPGIDVDRHPEATMVRTAPATVRFLEWDLVEKVVLTALIAVIFAQILPNTDTTPLRIVVIVGVVTVTNAWLSQWLAHHRIAWRSVLGQFAAMTALNAAIVTVVFVLGRNDRIDRGATVFFLLLLTLVITLYDRFRPLRSAGYPLVRSGSTDDPAGLAVPTP